MLIESDLLLPLFKKNDRYALVSEKILRGIQEGVYEDVYASTATIQEIVFWLYNQGMHQETIDAVNALNQLNNLEWVPVTPEICLKSSILIKHYQLSPFDAYHAATALSRDSAILSTDHIYERISQITCINPRDLVKE